MVVRVLHHFIEPISVPRPGMPPVKWMQSSSCCWNAETFRRYLATQDGTQRCLAMRPLDLSCQACCCRCRKECCSPFLGSLRKDQPTLLFTRLSCREPKSMAGSQLNISWRSAVWASWIASQTMLRKLYIAISRPFRSRVFLSIDQLMFVRGPSFLAVSRPKASDSKSWLMG